MHTDNPVYSCNEYKRCLSYVELYDVCTKLRVDCSNLLKIANDLSMYIDGTQQYNAALQRLHDYENPKCTESIETIANKAMESWFMASVEEIH